jgi:hypothetical protein
VVAVVTVVFAVEVAFAVVVDGAASAAVVVDVVAGEIVEVTAVDTVAVEDAAAAFEYVAFAEEDWVYTLVMLGAMEVHPIIWTFYSEEH